MTDFLTSQTGFIASLVVVLGIAVALKTLVGGYVNSAASIVISDLAVTDPPASSDIGYIHFLVLNTGNRTGIINSMSIDVESYTPSVTNRMVHSEAALTVFDHEVHIDGDRDRFTFRDPGQPGGAAPLSLEAKHSDHIRIKVTSEHTLTYRLRVSLRYTDTGRLLRSLQAQSKVFTLDFPPTAEELLDRM